MSSSATSRLPYDQLTLPNPKAPGLERNVESIDDGSPPPFEQTVAADRLRRKLSARQVQMIAIGGTIGTGLFLGTGKSLAMGGPASMLIAYALVGGIVFITMLSLGEMAAFLPVAGSFCTYARSVLENSLFIFHSLHRSHFSN